MNTKKEVADRMQAAALAKAAAARAAEDRAEEAADARRRVAELEGQLSVAEGLQVCAGKLGFMVQGVRCMLGFVRTKAQQRWGAQAGFAAQLVPARHCG